LEKKIRIRNITQVENYLDTARCEIHKPVLPKIKLLWGVCLVVTSGPGCTAAIRLIVRPVFLEVPTVAVRCLHVLRDARDPSSEEGEL
jgi:hypothetical protein